MKLYSGVRAGSEAHPQGQATDKGADWRDRIRCRGVDPELFFPVGHGPADVIQEERAKVLCRQCPVRAECLTWAQTTGQEHGIWGGLTADERRHARRNGAITR